MLQEGILGNKRSKEEELRTMAEIHKILPTRDDDEIMELLGLANSTYYRYKSKIYKEARKISKQICKESVEHRALLTKKSLELCIKVNQEIAIDPKQPAKDRIEASEVMVQAEEELLMLIKDGPNLTNLTNN